MTIYILGTPEETAQALDDDALIKMIKAIVRVLCNIHCSLLGEGRNHVELEKVIDVFKLKDYFIKTPLTLYDGWTQWGRDRLANYRYLVLLGYSLIDEHYTRFTGCPMITHLTEKHRIKEEKIFLWARNFEPDIYNPSEIVCTNINCRAPYVSSTRDESAIYEAFSKGRPCIKCKEFSVQLIKDKPTPFPMVIPKKYRAGMFDYKDEEVKHDIVLSYRNYYQAKLIRRAKGRCSYVTDDGERCYEEPHAITWTRRDRPSWISLDF